MENVALEMLATTLNVFFFKFIEPNKYEALNLGNGARITEPNSVLSFFFPFYGKHSSPPVCRNSIEAFLFCFVFNLL